MRRGGADWTPKMLLAVVSGEAGGWGPGGAAGAASPTICAFRLSCTVSRDCKRRSSDDSGVLAPDRPCRKPAVGTVVDGS